MGFRLHSQNLADRTRIVPEVHAIAGTYLQDSTTQPGQQPLAMLGRPLPLSESVEALIEAREQGVANLV